MEREKEEYIIGDDFKVIYDARHFIVSFKIEKALRQGKPAFVPVYWKIFSTNNLTVQIKHKFNSTNKQMYKKISRRTCLELETCQI